MSCQLLLRAPYSVRLCQLAHTSSLPPTTKAGFDNLTKIYLREQFNAMTLAPFTNMSDIKITKHFIPTYQYDFMYFGENTTTK